MVNLQGSNQSLLQIQCQFIFQRMFRKLITKLKDQIIHAEISRCLGIIHSNISFSGAIKNSEKYKQMFPESVVTNVYKQKADKLKFMVQFGTAPYIKRIIYNELKKMLFTLHFDEAAISDKNTI